MKLAALLLFAPLMSAAQSITIAPAEQATRDQARKALLVAELRIEVEALQAATASGADTAQHRANIAALAREMKLTTTVVSPQQPKKGARWCDAFCKSRSSSNHEGTP